jgi:hypothetical protein
MLRTLSFLSPAVFSPVLARIGLVEILFTGVATYSSICSSGLVSPQQ